MPQQARTHIFAFVLVFLYVCGVTRGYIDLDCALLLTNHMLNYITITLLVAIAIAIMIDLSSGLQIHRLNLSLCT